MFCVHDLTDFYFKGMIWYNADVKGNQISCGLKEN